MRSIVPPKLGVKMSPDEAKSFVDEINQKVIRRWDERVTQGPFMRPFIEGRLPRPALKLFFKNWGAFTVEINTLIAASYHKHIGFFKRQPDLLAPFGAKIADEFMHPNSWTPAWIFSRFKRCHAVSSLLSLLAMRTAAVWVLTPTPSVVIWISC
jgi:hypothetical protein